MKHSAKEKLKLIYRIQSGEPLKRIAKETGLGQVYLSVLYDRYKKYGKKGLERKVNRYHSPKEKEFIIRLHEEKGVSLCQIYTDYDISPSVFKRLLIKVRTYGYQSLYEHRCEDAHPKTLWYDRRRKNLRQNLKSFRQKISV